MLVLGLGNVLCGDDGLGVAAVARLASEYELGPEVRLADGGTLGLALLGLFDDVDDVLLVDAILTDAPAGSLVRLDGEDVAPAVRERLSVHQVGVADLMDALHLTGRVPPRISLVGLVPRSFELDLARSPEVERGLPGLVETLVEEIRGRGHAVSVRRAHGAPGQGPVGDDAARALGL
jgi:hydrogenase maturation protease